MKILRDLFAGVGNHSFDLARVLSALAFVAVSAVAGYKVHRGMDVSVTDLANAYGVLFAACAVFIGGKDLAGAKAAKG